MQSLGLGSISDSPGTEKGTDMITLHFSTIDHSYSTRHYKTLKAASAAARRRLGDHPEMGSYYAVAGDGVVKVTVEGATLAELFPEDRE